MVTMTCPWCEEDALLPLTEVHEAAASFHCPECGTSIEFVEEPVALDLAA